MATNSVLPQGYEGSTHLNPIIRTYDDLSDRIKIQLGAPRISLEACDGQIYDNISNAIEYFSKFAGYTEEYLVFDSKLYVPGRGIPIDVLINKTPETSTTTANALSGGYDGDLADYRKVVDVFAVEQGSSTGINTLFTMEQSMAQQIYSSYMVGNFGFDLITWETLKGFIDTRDKVLALKPYFRFDGRTQLLKIIPEPSTTSTYLGIVGCWLERPIKDLIKERWVQKYALALTMIEMGHMRGKFANVSMFGGGTINYSDILVRGYADKDTLEAEITTQKIDSEPPMWFIG